MRWLKQNLGFILFMLGMLAARSSLADHYLVPSGSMEGTLFAGDVVVFDAPDDGTRLIKRIVAVGGDRLEVRGGRVLRQGGGPDVPPLVIPIGPL